ncbi:MAG: hypothetical protein FJ290_05915 [Planctomycetes bacterium]|nr:hypothetical protein [Planctomycetota bacterium]
MPRIWLGRCLVLAAALLIGCGRARNSVEGNWEAAIVERNGPPVQVGIRLDADPKTGGLSGTFTILGDTPGPDIKKGDSFPLKGVKLEGSKLTFVAVLFAGDDNDNLHFDLELKGGRLTGTACEGRHVAKPGRAMALTFHRTH